ncbi:MAG: DUF1624 domain-containing protein [Candidatus Altiarchaeota archaeon]|nr:DUF1624 domain-containing protein [Candidatus Altiarchaeota archaeon]
MARDKIVDSMRGLAIVAMLFDHAIRNLLVDAMNSMLFWTPYLIIHQFGIFFFIIAGYCVNLSAEKRTGRGDRKAFLIHLFKRSIFIFASGFVINLIRVDPMLHWNVIHLIGLSVFLCGILRVSDNKKACAAIFALLIAYSIIGPNVTSEMPVTNLSDLFYSVFFVGEFPLVSYLIYFIMGLGIGWFGLDKKFPHDKTLWIIYFLGLFFILSLLIIPFGFFESNFPFVLFVILYLVASYSGLTLMKPEKVFSPVFDMLSSYGRYSFHIYFTHQFLFIFVAKYFGVQNTFSFATAVSFFVLYSLASYALIKKLGH